MWKGFGKLLQDLVGQISRECCDGQTLASLRRWTVNQRRYPENLALQDVSSLLMNYAQTSDTLELIIKLAWDTLAS